VDITADKLKKIMPYSGKRISAFLPHILKYTEEYNINSPLRFSAWIAQIAHESGELRYVNELASGEDYADREDLGNTKPDAIRRAMGKNVGAFYKGHGLIQITGYDNHAQCSKALFGDDRLLDNPLLLVSPENAVASACWFWVSRGLNAYADKEAMQTITRRINGGLNGFPERMRYYKEARRQFDYT